MPRGPKGEKRPVDVIGNAVHVMRIATGEIEDKVTDDGKNAAAVALGRMGGKARSVQERKFKLRHYPASDSFPASPLRGPSGRACPGKGAPAQGHYGPLAAGFRPFWANGTPTIAGGAWAGRAGRAGAIRGGQGHAKGRLRC
jgi:hypothetical protein